MITDIPLALQSNKNVVPFVIRANELESVNPIVSYFCKFHVLEYILNQKLHKVDQESEAFTIQLLDETEQMKNNQDENLQKVLEDKNMAIKVVLNFSLKIFNGCLTDLNNYNGLNKPALVSKIKACLNFLSLIDIFKNDDIDISGLTNGSFQDFSLFSSSINQKIKLMKYNLSKLLKDEIQIKGEEDEFDRELKELETENVGNEAEEDVDAVADDGAADADAVAAAAADETPATNHIDAPTPHSPDDNGSPGSPGVHGIAHSSSESLDAVNLPPVPHIDPQDTGDIKLPGAPKFLPGDDLSHINKNSSIQVFPKDQKDLKDSKDQKGSKDVKEPKSTPKEHNFPREGPHYTKDNINSILDKQELISKIQKHCKFAASALNYEDLETAEKELLQSLELIRLVKNSNVS